MCQSARRVSFHVSHRALHLPPPRHTPSTALCPPCTSVDGTPLLPKNIIYKLPGVVLLRQLIVGFGFFAVGSITDRNNKEGEGNTTFGIQNSAQKFLNFRFCGAVITTIIASISLQMLALASPITFLNLLGMYILLIITLFLEFAGISFRACPIFLYHAIVHSILSTLGITSMYDPGPLWEHTTGDTLRRGRGINGVEVHKEWVQDAIEVAHVGV